MRIRFITLALGVPLITVSTVRASFITIEDEAKTATSYTNLSGSPSSTYESSLTALVNSTNVDATPPFALAASAITYDPTIIIVNNGNGGVASPILDVSPFGTSFQTQGYIGINTVGEAVNPLYVALWINNYDASKIKYLYAYHQAPNVGMEMADSGYLFQSRAPDLVLTFYNTMTREAFGYSFSGTNMSLAAIAAVPEPATLGLLTFGAIVLLSRSRK